MDWLQNSTICQPGPLGANLYNGAVGVGVFLAANARVNADAQSANLARAAVAALRHDLLGANARRSARALGVGGCTGLGSIVYGLTVIAALTGDKDPLTDGLQISRLIGDADPTQVAEADLMDGLAGAVLGLLNSIAPQTRLRCCSTPKRAGAGSSSEVKQV